MDTQAASILTPDQGITVTLKIASRRQAAEEGFPTSGSVQRLTKALSPQLAPDPVQVAGHPGIDSGQVWPGTAAPPRHEACNTPVQRGRSATKGPELRLDFGLRRVIMLKHSPMWTCPVDRRQSTGAASSALMGRHAVGLLLTLCELSGARNRPAELVSRQPTVVCSTERKQCKIDSPGEYSRKKKLGITRVPQWNTTCHFRSRGWARYTPVVFACVPGTGAKSESENENREREREYGYSRSCGSRTKKISDCIPMTSRLPSFPAMCNGPPLSPWKSTSIIRCRWSAGFLRDLPFHPPLHSDTAPFFHHFTLIGSQDVVVKNHQNLSTQLNFILITIDEGKSLKAADDKCHEVCADGLHKPKSGMNVVKKISVIKSRRTKFYWLCPTLVNDKVLDASRELTTDVCYFLQTADGQTSKHFKRLKFTSGSKEALQRQWR
ncbi:hypothetical protein PR048_014976 [Dryococelus australis]|uniref:Uncharacterized protein n=1 Tax=Dryococelus australis TaxID=614101 RepID=A0ABQ9HFP4_9NEOP|nr:hypothetical protein PR048_014976 [Dryococelus australis]